ncbi:MAG: hypothetical protein E6G93_10525 [Alphaproteobacteria bacterium]|nr:MAG: hypothetical protein E6G93_10525 [Alphaproteobacteria bacterium]TMK42879.1 MAG: hypothetical protein E6G70_23810 [Alphaproteobacteria bacterium]
MAGLDPAIHVFVLGRLKTWMPGTSPGMTNVGAFENQACCSSSPCSMRSRPGSINSPFKRNSGAR